MPGVGVGDAEDVAQGVATGGRRVNALGVGEACSFGSGRPEVACVQLLFIRKRSTTNPPTAKAVSRRIMPLDASFLYMKLFGGMRTTGSAAATAFSRICFSRARATARAVCSSGESFSQADGSNSPA